MHKPKKKKKTKLNQKEINSMSEKKLRKYKLYTCHWHTEAPIKHLELLAFRRVSKRNHVKNQTGT